MSMQKVPTCDKAKGDHLRKKFTIAEKSDLSDFECIMNLLRSLSVLFHQDKGIGTGKLIWRIWRFP